mgnify:CR=1 FL=1
MLQLVLPAVRAPRTRGRQGEGEGRAHQLLRARHRGNPVSVVRRRTRCRAGASRISTRFRGRTSREPFREGVHAVPRTNPRSSARRRALRVADGRRCFLAAFAKVCSFSVFRKCQRVGVSCSSAGAMRKGFAFDARRYPRNAARSSPRGARPRGGASPDTPPSRHGRSRAVPGPGFDARPPRPTAPLRLSEAHWVANAESPNRPTRGAHRVGSVKIFSASLFLRVFRERAVETSF